ncbi:MAG TPA: phage tail sheath subtilisin-like domain-containing protein [Pyrinomonadaceae bacterium]|jgi:phage tail sheath protein FI|nr:phage tail sheath subtilisin-like domain-containing protein [Pyrinomonadaceae bacterium]
MPVYQSPGVYVEEVPSSIKPIAGASTSTPGFIGIVPDTITLAASRKPTPNNPATTKYVSYDVTTPADKPVLITNWTQFTKAFGDLVGDADAPEVGGGSPPSSPPDGDIDMGHRYLAHAVYGFFNNGGSRCYVARMTSVGGIGGVLRAFAAIDEIALVAAPGIVDDAVRSAIVSHCVNTGDRFAIFDGPETAADLTTLTKIGASGGVMPARTDYAAWYFPWIRVFDPSTKMLAPTSDGRISVPPSGHLAGIYARVDTNRGVHKAPANEVVQGALDVTQAISKAEQDGLNLRGVNCIRILNSNILAWGARTIGGDDNMDLKYINVRRTLLFLRESIDEGTQWVVFEPNTPALWQTITRNVTAFLTNVWRSGALFGNTPAEAFYVKCDAETNPPELRELGQVVTEIGVAIVRPAEFVIFRISQWSAPSK